MIAGLIFCASLTAVDGDTVKCDGQNMRLLGEGVPFVSGIDTSRRAGANLGFYFRRIFSIALPLASSSISLSR
ncbi:hypothetical protein AMC85_CH01148 [Rhizobium phaseoli]|nr:hypothetical protein AMC85_CH01148 [Rhizobium phaseoli]ANL90404.1 hypothetical protein AMC80_CH01085 [Rhizobium phaseoli]